MAEGIRPYYELVRDNRNFRRLWLSQIVSNFGDWFGVIAAYTITLRFTDSEVLLGLIIVSKMLSLAVFSPVAGYIADRFDRRTLMIGCDIGRGIVVLGFLLVRSPEWIWLIYAVIALQMMLAAVYQPAKQASIANIASGEELVRANILSNLSWSIIFTTGMGLGGLVTAWLGTDTVFVINSAGYILSTWFLFNAVIPHVRDAQYLQSLSKPFRGIVDGYRYLFNNPHILRPASAKGTNEFCIGALVYLLILVAEDILLMGSVGIGILYAARGLGTAVGPLFVRGVINDSRYWIQAMGFCLMAGGASYLVVGLMESIILMIVFVFLAHCGSGANWVLSTVMLQQRSDDAFRGRVFSAEWMFFTVTYSVGVLLASMILQMGWLELRTTILLFGALLLLTGVIWNFFITPQELRWQRYHQRREEQALRHQQRQTEPV